MSTPFRSSLKICNSISSEALGSLECELTNDHPCDHKHGGVTWEDDIYDAVIRYREEHKAKESMTTREEKVERHFRNSVTDKLIDLMKVMDPGGQRNWSYNYKDLLTAVKERIEAELLHENNFAEDETPPRTLTEAQAQGALALPKPTSSS